jgi:EF-P beta-lysylation protein EpmB
MELWQEEIRDGFRNVESLLSYLEIPASQLTSKSGNEKAYDFPSEFPLRVPLSFAQRMKKGDHYDPLFLQIIPRAQEQFSPPEFKLDAVGDLAAVKAKGLIQKYHGRVLLLMTSACAVHCRYCFRRNFPYEENKITSNSKEELISILENDSSIEEVIFSGGDPLLLSNNQLFEWAQALMKIPSVKRWRIHSRLASVLPSRIDEGLIEALSFFQKEERKTVLVNHVNHPQEINEEVIGVFGRLQKASITLLNQSVLLQQINDQMSILKLLSEKLFHAGVIPYYLHLLDRTKGTHHFEVEENRALEIHAQLAASLPGYLVPKLVREIQGEPNKVIISRSYTAN